MRHLRTVGSQTHCTLIELVRDVRCLPVYNALNRKEGNIAKLEELVSRISITNGGSSTNSILKNVVVTGSQVSTVFKNGDRKSDKNSLRKTTEQQRNDGDSVHGRNQEENGATKETAQDSDGCIDQQHKGSAIKESRKRSSADKSSETCTKR